MDLLLINPDSSAKNLIVGLASKDSYLSRKVEIRPQLVSMRTKEIEIDFIINEC